MQQKKLHNFSLAEFQQSYSNMVSTSLGNLLENFRRDGLDRLKEYSIADVERIVNDGSLEEKRILSRTFFARDGFYKKIIMHYAYLYKYAGLLIPNPSFGSSVSDTLVKKKYKLATDYLETMKIPVFFSNCSVQALVNGAYYGVVSEITDKKFHVIDLPAKYCYSRYKDLNGKDIIEFDLTYFNSISENERKKVLKSFPKCFSKAYKAFREGGGTSRFFIPTNISVYFSFLDGRPVFLDIIPATIYYDMAIANELDREAEEIKKIIVQKIPHLTSTGELLFEPPEAEEIHKGTSGMMRHNKNVSVLTTYADVDVVSSNGRGETTANTIEKMANNIFYKTGTSDQIFNATSSSAVDTSITNDMAFMSHLINKYSNFITEIVNMVFSHKKVNFKYTILPITYHNAFKYADNALKLANAGFSFLLPAVAMDLSQQDIINIKELENNVLDLREILIPLQSAFTQSAEDSGAQSAGREKKEQSEKAETTLAKEESLDKGGSIA